MRTVCGLKQCKSCEKLSVKYTAGATVISGNFDPEDYYKYTVNVLAVTTDSRFVPMERLAYMPFVRFTPMDNNVGKSDLIRLWIVIFVVVGLVIIGGPIAIFLFYYRTMKRVEYDLLNLQQSDDNRNTR
jgi:hypothetical protein